MTWTADSAAGGEFCPACGYKMAPGDDAWTDGEILVCSRRCAAAWSENRRRLVNLSPHEVTILAAEGKEIRLPAAEKPAGIETFLAPAGWIAAGGAKVTVGDERPSGIMDLPAPQKGVLYVASRMVAEMAVREGREDVVCPGRLVRDRDGSPIACRGLVRPRSEQRLLSRTT